MKQDVFERIRETVAAGREAELVFDAAGAAGWEGLAPRPARTGRENGQCSIPAGMESQEKPVSSCPRLHPDAGERPDQNAPIPAWTRRWTPGERLILLGGGHIAQPLCRMGAMVDFAVTVVDDRPSFADKSRFPEAKETVCDGFEQAIDRLSITSRDYVCVITRGHRYDKECLRRILKGEMPRYLGMIGSRRRVAGVMELLEEEGVERSLLERICAPIGLSIGAQTVAEIAVSIVAQLVEYRRKKGDRLEERECLSQTDINRELLDALATGGGTRVLALVVETKGSTPVKAGAMMAVNALGQIQGTIGGGCGEHEIIGAARKMAGTPGKKLLTVDMTNDAAAEEGMVCGGQMTVLLESLEV